MRNLQQVQVRTSSGFEKICPFPVGYIYMSTNGTSPASTYGGTWSPLTDSRFLRPSGSWNGQGGESTHKLTTSEMPSHGHSLYTGSALSDGNVDKYWGGNGRAARSPSTTWNSISNWDKMGMCITSGGGEAHNNLPPYRTCYAWYRTA